MNLVHEFLPRRLLPVIASRGKSSGVLALLLLGAFAMPGVLQAQSTTSTIRGVVEDAAGTPLPNAEVEVLDQRTGIIRTFTTNDAGAFLATRLLPGGPYTVIVNQTRTVVVESLAVADTYNLTINMEEVHLTEEVLVVGSSDAIVDVAAGPTATFTTLEVRTAPALNRDIVEVYTIDPRVNIDPGSRGFAVNCAGKNNRFNGITLDGISKADRFGLNSNGYSTAVGMPFPFDAIAQVAVELAPFDVNYGGFSACQINAVTKSGSNEWHGSVFYEHTSDSLRGNLGDDPPSFNDRAAGGTFGGPIIKDKLFFFAAFENNSFFEPLAMGFVGSGNGVERDWYSQADHDRIVSIADDVYSYDTGGQPSDGAREADKVLLRLDWNVNQNHNVTFIFNYFDGFEDRASDNDLNEFEFANHFYRKGSEDTTYTLKLASQWTNTFSTELFVSRNEMIDSQVTVGPGDFGDFQISVGGRDGTVYLGADDSRQANALNTDADFYKLLGQLLAGKHVITGAYEREKFTIFNQFVQHARGGEYDFFDDSPGNPAHCAGLSAQGRFDDPACDPSGIDRFELGRPSRFYYGSGGGTNDPDDAAALFSNTQNALYVQDEIFLDEHGLTLVAGLRYEFFTSNDRPVFNQNFTDANDGLRNDENIDGLSLLMPRVGLTWVVNEDLTVRGGIGRYSGGNPGVWISNAWSNDGLTNVQLRTNNYSGSGSILDGSIPLTGSGQPGRDVSQALFDTVANTTPASGRDSSLVLISPDYKQPSEWKLAVGATYRLPGDVQADVDYLHTELVDSAHYVDMSQEIVGTTLAGAPVYDYTNGEDNYMLTNTDVGASSDIFSLMLRKFWASGLDMFLGYSYIRAEEVVPMNAAVAYSNFVGVALNDINNPGAGTSNYVVPHRFTLRASYGRDLLEGLETRFTAYVDVKEGQPQTFVMSSGDLEGDGYDSRHLLYVPDGASDPNVVLAGGFETNEFFAFVDREGLEPGFVPRNGTHAEWTKRVDIRFDQEIPTGLGGAKGNFYLKMYNVGNFLNEDWGNVWDARFAPPQVVDSDLNDEGQYVFNSFSDRSVSDLLENRSMWQVRVGIGITF